MVVISKVGVIFMCLIPNDKRKKIPLFFPLPFSIIIFHFVDLIRFSALIFFC